MPMSDYIRGLRDRIGTTVLEVPTVSVLVFDERERILLVRHVEGNDWTTPGGMIEPYETPLTQVVGVFGGALCASTYANGDQVAWVSTVFRAMRVSGELRPDGEETLETRYVDRADIGALRCKPHARLFVDAGYASSPVAQFQAPTWRPPAA